MSRRRRVFWLAAFLMMASLAASDADIYKWVDEEGNVHFGDTPPEHVASELIQVEASGTAPHPESGPQLHEQMMERVERRVAARKERAAAGQAEAEQRLQQQQRCSYARQQLISLQQELPVYRDEEGRFRTVSVYDAYEGEREYLDDESRAIEIARVTQDIVAICEDPDDPKEQIMAGLERKRMKRCETARLELKTILQDRHSPRQTIEDAKRKVEDLCNN